VWYGVVVVRALISEDDAVGGIRGEDGGTNLWEGALGEDAGIRLAYTVRKRLHGVFRHSHEQAGLAACTVTNNDQLATDLRHLR
jgi:hypothetical protein